MPSLYALVISVSKYANPAHNLPGCANDFDTMMELLRQQAALHQLTPEIIPLRDENATRDNIIASFDHFTRAGKEDICLFYFSGHGSYVPVDDVFYNNSSLRNESLVCHDSRKVAGRDLMDKELAYLAHRAMHENGPRFISILDCCHSGSAFRSAEEDAGSGSYAKERQTSPAGYVAPKDYLGYDEYEDIGGKKRPKPYPALHISACQSHQRAREINLGGKPQGIFTYCLNRELSVVNPSLSVGELINRINFLAHTMNANQYPELESDRPEWRDEPLFGPTEADGVQNYFSRTFQIGNRGGAWLLNAGAQQGIQPGTTDHPTVLEGQEGSLWRVESLKETSAVVRMLDAEPESQKLYNVTIRDNGASKLKIGFHPDLPAQWKQLFLAEAHNFPALELMSEAGAYIQYRIDPLVDCAILVRPDEGTPLFERHEIFSGENGIKPVRSFLEMTQSVAAWETVLSLNNPGTQIMDGDIKVKITVDDGNPEPLVVDRFGEEVPLHYYIDDDQQELEPAYRIEIMNTSNHTYYVSAVYLSTDFLITNELLVKQEIAPGGQLYLGTTESDPWLYADFKEAYRSWGITEVLDRVRLFISRSNELNTSGFNQEGLPLDDKKNYRGEAKDRGFKRGRTQPNQRDWTVKTIPLRLIRQLRSTEINEHGSAKIHGLKVASTPAGFSAKAKLGTLLTGSRSVQAPLPPALTSSPLLSLNSAEGERNLNEQLNVLELTEVSGKEQISIDHPLKIKTDALHLGAHESLIPFSFDPVSQCYFPLGRMNENGELTIEDLPDEVVEERSLGGSIKIFFQKIIGSKVGVPTEYPLLRRVEENEAGVLVYTDENLADIKAFVERPEVKNVVVFIHGIIGDTTTSPGLIQTIAKAPDGAGDEFFQAVLTFDYENLNTNIDQTAKDFKKRLEAVGFGQNGKKLYVFAHSMGGLVSRWMIEKEGGDKLVEELYTFGTPHGGSPWSNVAEMFTSAVTYAINGATISNFWLAPLLGLSKLWNATQVTLEEMNADGAFMKRLNDGAEAPIPYTLIAGNTQLIGAMSPERTKSFIKRLIHRFRNQPHYALLDLALFKSPNDIAVNIESQQLVRGSQVRKPDPIGCDHLNYFGNEEVAKLVAKLLD